MKVGKPKSKRVPVRLRHKIEKASAAKQRKAKKLAKKDPTWRSKLKKDPGIPNLFPYKEKLLQEIEEKKRLRQEEDDKRREEARARKLAMGEDPEEDEENEDLDDENEDEDEGSEGDDAMEADNSGSNPMAALLASARARAAEYEQEIGEDDDAMEEDDTNNWNGLEDDGDSGRATRKDTSRKAFDKIFKQVVDAADVVLYVLDARDPEGTRSKEVERMVMAAEGGNKRLILILNKVDLIPPNVLKSWLTHLRRYFPTLPLRASNPAPNAKTFDHKQLSVKGTSEALFKALKSYAQHKNLKRSVSVGVIGYPNVGKSSVINALTSRMGHRNPSCPVGAEAGVTTALREVKLDNKLRLLDSPGIVFPSAASPDGTTTSTISSRSARNSSTEEQARLILLNAIPPRDIVDPVPAVSLLLKRLSSSDSLFSNLLAVYDLPPLYSPHGDITTDFLVQVARKRGRLGRGGVPNVSAAAMTVVSDWRDGRIQGWAEAPKIEVVETEKASAGAAAPEVGTLKDQKVVVKEWAEEFKIDGLWGDDAPNVEMEDA